MWRGSRRCAAGNWPASTACPSRTRISATTPPSRADSTWSCLDGTTRPSPLVTSSTRAKAAQTTSQRHGRGGQAHQLLGALRALAAHHPGGGSLEVGDARHHQTRSAARRRSQSRAGSVFSSRARPSQAARDGAARPHDDGGARRHAGRADVGVADGFPVMALSGSSPGTVSGPLGVVHRECSRACSVMMQPSRCGRSAALP